MTTNGEIKKREIAGMIEEKKEKKRKKWLESENYEDTTDIGVDKFLTKEPPPLR